jgi:hypothetical protein
VAAHDNRAYDKQRDNWRCPVCGHRATTDDPCICDLFEDGYLERFEAYVKEREGRGNAR